MRARGRLELGIGSFVNEEGGYTSVAVALSLLLSIALTLSLASAAWVQNRSADVQSVADAAALAGENVTAAYTTVATTLDACVLTLGLAGLVALGAGLVASAIPGLSAVGATTVAAGSRVLDARRTFATSAAQGLKAIEATLPLAIVARSAAVVGANETDSSSYVGCAVPFPMQSETDFSALDEEIDAEDMVEVSARLQEGSDRVKQAEDAVDAALLEGWLADCGSEPMSLQERADVLAGLGSTQNPDYATVDGWTFGVALLRARAYYARRVAIESPDSGGIAALTDSICRSHFYAYALSEVRAGHFEQYADGTVDVSLPELPSNTSEMRQTSLYTDACWPCTQEDGITTMHSTLSCPGAVGKACGSISLAAFEAGAAALCSSCRMSASDMGKVAAASTSISNGFEHYWQRIVEASRAYDAAADELAEAKRDLEAVADEAAGSFEEALEALSVPRPKLCPPGAWGCVAVVLRSGEATSPSELAGTLAGTAELPRGAAISAATLAPDDAAQGNDTITRLFEALSQDMGEGTAGVLGSIGSLWGSLLQGYSSAAEGLSSATDEALDAIEGLPVASAASWLRDRVVQVVEAAGFAPADLRLRKPVLTNSQNVLDEAGATGLATAREIVGRLPDSTDPLVLARSLGQELVNELGSGSFMVAELPIPGTGETIPLTIDVGELLGAVGT